MGLIITALVGAGCAALFSIYLTRGILAQDTGTEAMRRIAAASQEGAAAFLRREYIFLSAFVVLVATVIAVFVDFDVLDKFEELGIGEQGNLTDLPRTAIAYVIGAIASASAGYIGMNIAVRANVRTAATRTTNADRKLYSRLRTAAAPS